MSKKYNYDYIKKSFELENYTLLSPTYLNNKQRLEFICSNNHHGYIAWYHWQEGHRCLQCVGLHNSIRFRLDITSVKTDFSSAGYILLSSNYINAHKHLSYICPNGHRHSMTWNNWSKGYRCPTCDKLNRSGDGHWNWRGGVSCEPYCDVWLDKEFKESIKFRDNYRCQNSHCSGKFTHKLCIHHIDYNKKNCHPDNLITLCLSCNGRANYNREYWQDFYSRRLKLYG